MSAPNDSEAKRLHQAFRPFAFPVAKVTYSGNAARYYASMYRDTDRTYRAQHAYEYGESSDGSQAIHAATLCLAKSLADSSSDMKVSDYVAVPGDLNADSYVFTFVPAYFFDRSES
jgi:hypothetical protein